MHDRLIILAHQGLGDHIVCNGLYRSLISEQEHCLIPVKASYFTEVREMFSDEPRIRIIKIPNFQWIEYAKNLRKELERKGYESVGLGIFGDSFMSDESVRLDARFYSQAKLDLSCRWDNFYVPRNSRRENQKYLDFALKKHTYYFLHEDPSRNYLIDRKYLDPKKTVFSPDKKHRMPLADYSLIIENAFEIHCIESSFSAYIEQLNPEVKKFAHRYSRPEARDDFRYEYTYKTNWTIYGQPSEEF